MPQDYAELRDKILIRIRAERRRRARARTAAFTGVSVLALSGLIPAWNELTLEISKSGFLQLISLIFSDAAAVRAYWQDFLFSIAESFPAIGLIFVLASLFGIILSLRFLWQDIPAAFFGRNLKTINA